MQCTRVGAMARAPRRNKKKHFKQIAAEYHCAACVRSAESIHAGKECVHVFVKAKAAQINKSVGVPNSLNVDVGYSAVEQVDLDKKKDT